MERERSSGLPVRFRNTKFADGSIDEGNFFTQVIQIYPELVEAGTVECKLAWGTRGLAAGLNDQDLLDLTKKVRELKQKEPERDSLYCITGVILENLEQLVKERSIKPNGPDDGDMLE